MLTKVRSALPFDSFQSSVIVDCYVSVFFCLIRLRQQWHRCNLRFSEKPASSDYMAALKACSGHLAFAKFFERVRQYSSVSHKILVDVLNELHPLILSNAWERFFRALIAKTDQNLDIAAFRSVFLNQLALFASFFKAFFHILVSQMRAGRSVVDLVSVGVYLIEKTIDAFPPVSEPRDSLVQQICGDVRGFVTVYREIYKHAGTPCELMVFTAQFARFIETYLSCPGFLKSVLPLDFLCEIVVFFGCFPDNVPTLMKFFVFAERVIPELFTHEEIVTLLIRMLDLEPLKALTLLQVIHRRRRDLFLLEEEDRKSVV
jgi:hypothetical protein